MRMIERMNVLVRCALFVGAVLIVPACSKKEPTAQAAEQGAATESPEAVKARMKKEIDAKNAQQVADQLQKEINSDH